jgi:adenylate cyclase
MALFATAIHDLTSSESASATTREGLSRVLTDVETKLRVVVETLSLLGDTAEGQQFDQALDALLRAIVACASSLVGSEFFDVFSYDPDHGEIYTVRRSADGREVELRLPVEGGVVGEALVTGHAVSLGYDLYEDHRARDLVKLDELLGVRSYTALVVPLVGKGGDPLGLVFAFNRRRDGQLDRDGFGPADEAALEPVVPVLASILECERTLRAAIQKQRAVAALMHATSSISRSSLDLEETLKRVMDEAKELMNADRSTLWLVDHDAKQLWTKIATADGVYQEIRIPINAGFAGLVATSGHAVNIPFDLYNHPNAFTAKQVDQRTGYRTCSLLCLPVLNADGELIGVTQLVNKRRSGGGEPYDSKNWPEPPDCWRASFTRADQEYMEAFNQQAGVALQNAKLFDTIKQQEQMQRDILRHLTNGVIATDATGLVVAANASALAVLGLPEDAAIEGQAVTDLIRIQDADFGAWFAAALSPEDEKAHQQYYPEQILAGEQERSVNLSISSMIDATGAGRVRGVLVVMDDISDEKRLKTTMYRYMTQELAEQLLQHSDLIRLGGDRKHVTVLFSDIRSYTTLTENMEPEDVVKMLNEYFEAMVEAVFNHKGTLDKYIGDAIMAVFGSPLAIEDHAWCAVQSAVEMRHRLEDFNALRRAAGLPEFQIGMGINSDEVLTGNIGSSKRMEFTAIGDGINLGSRLEGVSKVYGCDIIISEETYRLCDGRLVCRELDTIRVKGKSAPVGIYELVEVAEGPFARPVSETKCEQIEHYRAGRALYAQREFTKAQRAFERALELTPGDKASELHIERCKQFIAEAPPTSWSGVWVLKEK